MDTDFDANSTGVEADTDAYSEAYDTIPKSRTRYMASDNKIPF